VVDVVAVEIAASPHERPPTARARVGTNADKTLPSAQRIARQKVRRVRGTCGHAAHPTELDALTHELFDDRPKVSPGVKFKDYELLGMPYVVVLGRSFADGKVELRVRGGETEELPYGEVVARVSELARG